MNRERVVKAAYFMCLALGEHPSRRNVNTQIVKTLGKGFRPEFIASQLLIIHAELREPLRNQSETIREPSSEPHVRHKKRFLGTTESIQREPQGNPLPLDTDTKIKSLVVANATTERPKKTPTEIDLRAYALLNACYPVVVEHRGKLAMTRADWLKRNKATALSLLAAEKTPEECVARLKLAYTGPKKEFYGGMVMLDKLQAHWTALGELPRPVSVIRETYKPPDPEMSEEKMAENRRRFAGMFQEMADKKRLAV